MQFRHTLLRFKYENFASFLSDASRGKQRTLTDSNGHGWLLILNPAPVVDGSESDWINLTLRISGSLYYNDNDVIERRYNISIKSAKGDNVKQIQCDGKSPNFPTCPKFMKHSEIIDASKNILIDGALHIKVTIQIKDKENHLFQPESEHSSRMHNLLKSGEKADASFNVGGRAFPVHSQIIFAHAPILANHCDGSIDDITPEAFQLLLEYIYSGLKPTKDDTLKQCKDLINAANKYELVELKLYVENVLVRERILTEENVADYILFADAQCCPLLKEYAMAFFTVHCREVLLSEHSKCFKESMELMSEIMLLCILII